MRIICTDSKEERLAEALCNTANAAGFQTDIVRRRNAYSLTLWSLDDVDAMRDERVKTMSAADKEAFMAYAERQLKADMTERGWDSLDTLLDEYFHQKERESQTGENGTPANTPEPAGSLDEILIKYFGKGFPLPESPSCESYGTLVSLLYDIAALTGESMETLVETLDDISNENALRDENGDLIYDENQIIKELARREALIDQEENE